MNRIEARLQEVQQRGEKAFVTYMTAGLPDMKGMQEIIKEAEQAGCDVLELGIPFSDPVADGPVIQAASYKAICQGVNIRAVFAAVKELREAGTKLPIVFMLYYNTILHYGVEEFVKKCMETGVNGMIVPDLPYEEQGELRAAIEQAGNEDSVPILIQLVSPVSGDRIPMLLEGARGFVYCVSSMGVTGQAADFHKEVASYLKDVKKHAKIPVMMGFGIRTAKDVEALKEYLDGVIVGSHFIRILEESGYSKQAAADYIKSFKEELNERG